MGWTNGSQLAEDAWKLVRNFIPEKSREEIAYKFIHLFEDEDCDTMDEAVTLQRDTGELQ